MARAANSSSQGDQVITIDVESVDYTIEVDNVAQGDGVAGIELAWADASNRIFMWLDGAHIQVGKIDGGSFSVPSSSDHNKSFSTGDLSRYTVVRRGGKFWIYFDGRGLSYVTAGATIAAATNVGIFTNGAADGITDFRVYDES